MKPCRLCQGTEIQRIQKGTRDRADIDVFRCRACGLVFLSKAAADDQFYMDSQMRREISLEQWRENTYADDHRRFLKYQQQMQGRNILDFGCGNGGFLELAAKEGHAGRTVGVDLDMEAIQFLRKRGMECYESLSELPDVKFDMIFLFHVIEHLQNPEELLMDIAEHTAENGIIMMETPNADDALLSIYDCKAFAKFTYWSPHVYLYNESTLAKMLERAGFQVLEILQEQRYPLANHLRWLLRGLPGGGVQEFQELNEPELNAAYAKALERQKACDTLIGSCRRR